MKTQAQLEKELLSLPPAERARLALRAWESVVDDPVIASDPTIDPDGVRVAAQRDAELDSGSIEAIDDDEFRRRCGVMDED